MADPNKPPRSRGRAKGRARPPATQTRPGEEPQPAVAAVAISQPPMGSGGRQTHRGVPRSDTGGRPGEQQVSDITQQLGAVSLQPGRASQQVGRGTGSVPVRTSTYEDICTRSSELATKQGTVGDPIQLLTNYFKLESRPTWCVYQYHVDFAPVIESSRMRRAMLGDHRDVLGICYLFDGMSDLKTVQKLQQASTELFSKRRTDDETIRITVKYANELAPNNPQLGQLFNTQMRRNLTHLKYTLIGRHYFDKNAVIKKETLRLHIWQGVVTSIRMQETELMMLVDTVHKIVRQDTAHNILADLARRQSRDFKDIAVKELVGTIVMTKYNTRTYRIEEISWGENPNSTFESKEGPITYKEYYKRHYDIAISDLNQPLLLCTSKEREIRAGQSESKRIMLVPELCLMTGLDERMRSNFGLMKELATETKLDPLQRVRNLKTFITRINSNPDVTREMNAWDLSFSKNLVGLESRVLPAENIVQQASKSKYDIRTADFSKEMRGKPMHVPKNIQSWMVICPQNDRERCADFTNTLNRVCGPMGMRLRAPIVYFMNDDRIGTYSQTFRENFKQGQTELVVFIVPNNKKDRYDALKKLTCLEHPVPSQVIVSRTLSKKPMLMSVCTKIGIQLNCKLGGEPWAVEIPLNVPTMIIGYDTYHDSSKKGRSAGGFVASMNRNHTRWYSRVNFHQAGGWAELSDHLRTNLTEALKRFYTINGKVPELIIFYRDGVGDGQIRYVLDWEVKQMEKCICEVLEGGKPGVEGVPKTRYCFFVVNKRISTRFFHQTNQGEIKNPPPGTVVDHTVTRYDRYDFFLVSQSVRQGTVAPTMYNIIKDQSGLKPNHMQRLSYKLTHMYYNWPGTIRVPAPCQYAHKLAFLTGQSLHSEPHESLSDKLFYL